MLEKFACDGVLLAFDFDGTLAPIVPKAGAARMRISTAKLLKEVSRAFPVAIISGRSHRDLKLRLRGLKAYLIGNHGMDWGKATAESRAHTRLARAWLRSLRASLKGVAGVELEDKRVSLSVHYRKCANKAVALKRVRAAVKDLDGVRVVGGKMVFNLVPEGSMDKGAALLALCEREGFERAVFIGDDLTDEDVFRLGMPKKILSVRVGSRRGSAARYFIESQGRMDDFLRALLRARGGIRSV